jgi:EAL domain-containing protein (putative c-di-GMP-specific phosphodiesterase class I)
VPAAKPPAGACRAEPEGKLFLNVSPDPCWNRTPFRAHPEVLEQVGLSPSQVVIELTEQTPTEDFQLLQRPASLPRHGFLDCPG